MFLVENMYTAMLNCVRGKQVHRRRPRLPAVTHRLTRQPMEPFIEFPFLIFAKTHHGSQSLQLTTGVIQPASLYQGSHIDTANEGPCSTIMVVMRLVEISHAVIFAPVLLAGLDRWIKSTYWERIVQPTAMNVIQNFVGFPFVCHSEQNC